MMAGRVFDAVQRFRKVEEATSPKDEPAPVYLLDELVEVSNTSAENAQALVDLVVKKLGHKSPIVRFKALRVVKHMCTGGGVQFQRFMQKHSSAVRECVAFKGEPDPFKGDVPNERVRELAKQVIELLFVTQASTTSNASSQNHQARIQGFGSGTAGPACGSTSSSQSVTSSSASRYQGFGNPRFENSNNRAAPSSTSTYAAAASQAVVAAVNTVSNMMKSTSGKTGALQEYSGDSPRYCPAEQPYTYSAPAVVNASQVLGSEQQLVDDICAPGGLRATPDASDLQVFADATGALDGLKIGELLREKMDSDSWQVVLRALCALSAIVEKGSSVACGECAVMFQSDPTPVRNALSMPQALVQQQAAKVLKLILGEDAQLEPAVTAVKPGAQAGRPTARATPAAPAALAPDLLVMDSPTHQQPATNGAAAFDLLGELGSEPEPQPSSAAPAPADRGDALFSGLEVSSQPAPAAAPAATGGIDALSWDTGVATATAGANNTLQQQPLDSLLGGLDITNGSAPSSNGNLLGSPATDLLGSSTAALTPTPQPMAAGIGPGIMPQDTPSGMGQTGMAPGIGLAGMTPRTGQLGMAPGMGPSGMGLGRMVPAGMGSAVMTPGVVPGMNQAMGMVGGMPGASMGMGMGPNGRGAPGMMMGIGAVGAGQFLGAGAHPHGANAMGAPQGMMFMQGAPGVYGAGMQMQQVQQSGMVPGGFMQPFSRQNMEQPGGLVMGGGPALTTIGCGGLNQQPNWQGNDDLSALMRHVASHGKHDPAFDFIKDEFRTRS